MPRDVSRRNLLKTVAVMGTSALVGHQTVEERPEGQAVALENTVVGNYRAAGRSPEAKDGTVCRLDHLLSEGRAPEQSGKGGARKQRLPVNLGAAYDEMSLDRFETETWKDVSILNDVRVCVDRFYEDTYTLGVDFWDTGLEFYRDCCDGWMAGVYPSDADEPLYEFSRPQNDVYNGDVFEHQFADELISTCNNLYSQIHRPASDGGNMPRSAYDITISEEEIREVAGREQRYRRYGESAAQYDLTIHGDNGGHITYYVPQGVVPAPNPFGTDVDAETAQNILHDWSLILSYPRNLVCASRTR